MRLPHARRARVGRAKLVDYLLSGGHPLGRSKAAFFRSFGFAAADWPRLAASLEAHAKEHDVIRAEDTPFGTRYIVDGPLSTPDGRAPIVRAVWFVAAGDDVPRFVTAYPLKRTRS